MANIFSETSDGRVYYSNADWDTCRNAATGDTAVSNETAIREAMSVGASAIWRSFFYFDVSGEAGTVSSVTFNIYGYDRDHTEISIQLGTQGTPLTTADYDSFAGNSYGQSSSYAINQYNVISLNAQGISDLQTQIGSGIFKLCAREYINDYLDVGFAVAQNGCFYSDYVGTDRDPYIEITYGVGHNVAIIEHHYRMMRNRGVG